MLRISVVSSSKQQVVLKLEGRFLNEDVGLLEREGEHWLQRSEEVVLDVEGVLFIDPAGIALLKSWAQRGWRCAVGHCSSASC